MRRGLDDQTIAGGTASRRGCLLRREAWPHGMEVPLMAQRGDLVVVDDDGRIGAGLDFT